MVSWGEYNAENEKEFALHEGQAAVLQSQARFRAAIAGTGGGKTAMGPLFIAAEVARCEAQRDLSVEPILGFVVAPTYQVLARATVPTMLKLFAGTDLEGTYVPTQNRYYLPDNKGVIWTLSADNPNGLEGGQIDFAWLDEGGQVKYDAWVALQGRTGLKQSPILITTTPYGMNWLYHSFYKSFLAGDPDYFVRQWSSIANPSYPRKEYERAKKGMSAQRAAMRYDGKFVQMAGLVYPTLDECVVSHFEPPEGRKVGGIDWGWNNPFAALGGTVYENEYGDDVLYVHYERYMRRVPLSVHARHLDRETRWFADPAEPGSINELRRTGLTCRPSNNRIIPGIDAVSNRIYTKRLLISDRCLATIEEAKLYRYPEKDDEPTGDKPIDADNHALGALRYMIMGIDRRKIAQGEAEDAA